ncbi:MAG: hypothetical protein WKF85_07815 [Chitinophagaceae bacterium]
MRLILLFFFIVIFIFSCKKEPALNINCSTKTNSIDNVRQLMPGSYNWSYTIVRMMGNPTFTETPLTTGLNYKYTFYRNGTVDYYENNILKSNDNYVIDYEFKVTTYHLDSATIVIIKDKQTGQRKEFFRPWLCNDSARFYNPYNSIDRQRYFRRN